jgi:ribonuclease P protein component
VRALQETAAAPARATKAARIAAVAPVKIAKTSVARHRIRRRIYEATRSYVPKLAPGTTVLVFAKQPVIEATLPDLRQAISDIFVKAGLLR